MTTNNRYTSSTIAINSGRSDIIERYYDRDWHRVYLQAGASYRFDVQNCGVDPTLTLLNSNGGFVSFDDDGGYSNNSRLFYTADQTGEYFLDVGAYAGTTGSYYVSATQTSPGPVSVTPALPTSVVTTSNVDSSVNNSQVSTNSTVTNTTNNNVDNSIDNSVEQSFTITINGDNNSLGDFGNTMFQQTGTQGADILTGNSNEAASDVFRGMDGNDVLTGFRGGDVLVGDGGNDIIRGGNGRDVLTGGAGADELYGGFGQNTFTGELDGAANRLYFKSDHVAFNWVYGSAGNQDGNKVDVIGALDSFDSITVQGVDDWRLSFGSTTAFVQGQSVSGIGIFAANTLEAIYTGNNLTVGQLDSMTTGSLFA